MIYHFSLFDIRKEQEKIAFNDALENEYGITNFKSISLAHIKTEKELKEMKQYNNQLTLLRLLKNNYHPLVKNKCSCSSNITIFDKKILYNILGTYLDNLSKYEELENSIGFCSKCDILYITESKKVLLKKLGIYPFNARII